MCCYGNIVFSGPFKLKRLIQFYFYSTKQEESWKSKLVSFPMVKLFTSEIQSQVKKWWQSIILISLINERSDLLFFIIFALFMSYSTHVELRNCCRTLFTIFWLGISYRRNPNRKQSILAPKSQQVIFTMIFYQNSNAVCSKVNKVRRQFLSLTRVEYDMKDTLKADLIKSRQKLADQLLYKIQLKFIWMKIQRARIFSQKTLDFVGLKFLHSFF